MRISDWSSDVCSSDLRLQIRLEPVGRRIGPTLPAADHPRAAAGDGERHSRGEAHRRAHQGQRQLPEHGGPAVAFSASSIRTEWAAFHTSSSSPPPMPPPLSPPTPPFPPTPPPP